MTNKGKQTEIAKYGSEEAYKEAMKGRRARVKRYYFQEHPEAAKAMAEKRWKKDGGQTQESS